MDCQIRRADDFAEMVLVGSLDSSWSSYLSDRIDEVVRSGALDIRVNMAGVSYLSSNGIALLIRYFRQLREIGGRFRIVADSEAVGRVLRLTGAYGVLREYDRPSAAPDTASPARCEVVERDGMVLQVYPKAMDGRASRLELIGDPARLPGRGYDEADERTWMAVPGAVALGLGALGPCFEACRERFGEVMAVAGVAAYRPSAGPGRPDFEQAAGAFVPGVRLLYGLAFPADRASVVRFEAKGEPGGESVPLSRIAGTCLDQAGTGVVGIVLAGESEGLVGAALRRSPAGLPDGARPVRPPRRARLALAHARARARPEHGPGRRRGDPRARARPCGRSSGRWVDHRRPDLQGHFHAAVVPYRPLPGGPVELSATVKHLFEPGRIETILHLLGDSRPILGAGESTFTRGVAWYVPLAVAGEAESP